LLVDFRPSRNFLTRNLRKSIKGSKDSDSSLASNKNLSRILSSNGWRLGPGNLSQNGQKPTLWHHSQKNETQNQKFFLLQNWRLTKSF